MCQMAHIAYFALKSLILALNRAILTDIGPIWCYFESKLELIAIFAISCVGALEKLF